MNIDEVLEPTGASLAAPAVADGSRTIRRDELIVAVRHMAGQLTAQGIGEHDRVAVEMGNDIDSVVRWLACLCTAGSVLAVDQALTTYERDRLIGQFEARAAVSSAGLDQYPRPPGQLADPLAGRIALSTSGTTGTPKVVARDWPSAVTNALDWAAAADAKPDTTIVATTPLHHSYALFAGLLTALVSGATLRVLPAPANLAAIPAALPPSGRTILLSIPFIYRRLARRPLPQSTGELALVSAGEGIDDQTAAAFEESWGNPVRSHLGTTEFGQLTLADRPGQGVGRPIAGVEVQARSVADEDQPELFWRATGAPPRYVESGLVRDCLTDGWLASGDLGHIDAQGCVWITGRHTTRLNIAGRKIDPTEIETAVRSFPGIADAAVTVLDGDDPRLCVLVEAKTPPDIASLRRFLATRLSSYKIPQRYLHVVRLPKTASGKLARHALPRFFARDE